MKYHRIGGLMAAAALVAMTTAGASAQNSLTFALDWQFEGPAAPFFVAIDEGYYEAEGLDVSIDAGQGSVENIGRIAAGTYPIGFADINSLIKFRDENPANPVMAVMMIYDKPAFSIATLAETGITEPKDLEGRVLGAPAADGAFAQWDAFVDANDIDADAVTIDNIGFPVREPMLAGGDVDAITGFSFSSHFNLISAGAEPDDIVIMLLADHGLDLYGNTIIVNPTFAEENPELVRGFLRATVRGWQHAIEDVEGAIDSLLQRNEIADRDIETQRLEMALDENVMTDWVMENGFGGVDMDRLSRSIDQIALTFEFSDRPSAEDIFTDEYLPPAEDRQF